jgi:chromate transport protein ChrA
MIQGVEYLAMVLVIVAVWLIGSKDIRGQWLMLAAQLAWAAVASVRDMPGLFVQCIVLAAFTVRSIVLWRRA